MGARRGEVGSKLQGPGERVDPGGCAFRGGIFHSKRWAGVRREVCGMRKRLRGAYEKKKKEKKKHSIN